MWPNCGRGRLRGACGACGLGKLVGLHGICGRGGDVRKSMGGEAYEDSGHSLDWYRSYNASRRSTPSIKRSGSKNDQVSPAPLWYLLKHIFCFDPFCHARYFSSLEDVPISDFSFCNDSSTMWTEPAFMNSYRGVVIWMACWRCRTDITPSARPSIVSG